MMNSNANRRAFFKLVVFLFVFNSISLYIYFSSHPDYFVRTNPKHDPKSPLENKQAPPLNHAGIISLVSSQAKPWPMLPSYLPWSNSNSPSAPLHSCEAFFGNGFDRRVDLLDVDSHGRGGSSKSWFRCFYSRTLRSSICEGGRMRMLPHKITMSVGGEPLEQVIGRSEEDEMPLFQPGSFDMDGGSGFAGGKKLVEKEFLDEFVPNAGISRHTMRDLIDSIHVVGEDQFLCSEWIEEPVLLVTRFEYANLFHTVTDWYSAYSASRVIGLPVRPHVIFVDGHCKAPLEEVWAAVFSSVRYAKSFGRPVCFRHVITTPLGYETTLFRGLSESVDCTGAPSHEIWLRPSDRKTARLSEFGEMLRAAFRLPADRQHRHSRKSSADHSVLFVRREDYLAHPRHSGRPQARLENELEVFEHLTAVFSNHSACRVDVVNGLFAHTGLKEQVRAVAEASVVVGAHGAGLTHVIAADPDTVVLEIISSEFRRPHFELISRWKGLEYHSIDLVGSTADPKTVAERLGGILRRSFDC